MKKFFVVLAIATLTFGLGSCRDEKKETPPPTIHTKEVIREVEKEKPKKEGVLERVGEKIDKKVEKKIDEKIDEFD